ncbi:MAG TPA: glycosyl hydrolase [Burkholderiaceae bacterium]|nr:glycosyl hydrolase [Burkholderiaceae bacterium]
MQARKIVAAICFSFVVFGVLAPGVARSEGAPARITHIHGLYFGADGALHIPGHRGIVRYTNDHWTRLPGPAHDFAGFAAGRDVLYGSGHREPGSKNAGSLGLKTSTDGGRTWSLKAMLDGSDFHNIATGYLSGAVYLLNETSSAQLPRPGIYGKKAASAPWRRAAMQGLVGEVKAIAVHPSEPGTVVVGTSSGLYLSRDAGDTFVLISGIQRVFAASFDRSGDAVWFGTYDRVAKLVRLDLKAGFAVRELTLPPLQGDAIAHIAFNPSSAGEMAIATTRRNLFVSRDDGSNWVQLLNEGDPERSTF